MSFDPASIGSEARASYIELGSHFGTDDVLAQLDLSLLGLEKYGADLVVFGWPASQTEKLRVLRDMIAAAVVQRAGAKASKKTANASLLDAMRNGKIARGTARTALATARNELFEKGELDIVNQIDAVLTVTSSSGDDPKRLVEQLGTLAGLITQDKVVSVLGDSAGPIETAVTTAIGALDATIKAKGRPHGTPAETEHLNFLEGAAVVLLRTLRKAARTAARALGRPDIADTFELNVLYRTTRRRPGEPDATTPPTT